MITETQALSLWEKFKGFFAKEQSDQITALTAELNARIVERDNERARANKASAELATTQEELRALQSEVSDLKSQVTTLTEAKGAADAKAVKEAAAKEAARIAAAAGQTEIPGEKGSNPGSGQSLVEQFNAITDPKARGEFYLKHFAPKFEKR